MIDLITKLIIALCDGIPEDLADIPRDMSLLTLENQNEIVEEHPVTPETVEPTSPKHQE